METLATRLDATAEAYASNRATQLALADELRKKLADAALGGPEKSRERHMARGKLLPRERIDQLLDDGSPFLEIAPLAANGMYNDEAPGAGVIAGIGLVHGRHVLVISNDATVKGGTYYPMTVKKHLRAQEIALENRLPCIYLVDSGGAFLPKQDEVFRTGTTSAASSITRPGSQRPRSPRSPRSWGPAPPAAPTFLP